MERRGFAVPRARGDPLSSSTCPNVCAAAPDPDPDEDVQYQCDECSRVFTTYGGLTAHQAHQRGRVDWTRRFVGSTSCPVCHGQHWTRLRVRHYLKTSKRYQTMIAYGCIPELSFLDTFWKKAQAIRDGHQERGSLSVRTKSSGTDGSTETAVQSDSGRDHLCTTRKRRWYLSDRITTPIRVG